MAAADAYYQWFKSRGGTYMEQSEPADLSPDAPSSPGDLLGVNAAGLAVSHGDAVAGAYAASAVMIASPLADRLPGLSLPMAVQAENMQAPELAARCGLGGRDGSIRCVSRHSWRLGPGARAAAEQGF